MAVQTCRLWYFGRFHLRSVNELQSLLLRVYRAADSKERSFVVFSRAHGELTLAAAAFLVERLLQGEGGVLVLDVDEDVTTRGRRRVPGGVLPSAPRWGGTEASDGGLVWWWCCCCC